MDYSINVCLSKERYDEKPLGDVISKMRFECKELSVDEFANAIAEGYSFCALMKNNWRRKDNFQCTSMLVYDIDHTATPMDEYIEKIEIKPTIAYTSPSNKEGDYGFRLIYLLDFEICNLQDYYTFSKSFSEQMKMKDVDEHSHLGEQYWNGNCNCECIIYINNILNKNNIILNTVYKREYNNKNTKSISKYYNKITQTLVLSDTFKKDYENLSFQDFIKKYYTVYPNIEHTPIEINEDEPIVYYPADYFEINRPSNFKNGETYKFADGERRRRKLYINGLVRRKINLDITFENLIFNLVYELEYYYINNGNRITKKDILEIATSVMKTDLDRFEDIGKPTNKFFVNPLYCEKYNVSKKEVLAKSKNKKQYIGEFYDISLTDQQNIDVMKEYGLDISIITLKRWKKENGVKKYKK